MNHTITDQHGLLESLAELYLHISAAKDELHANKIKGLIQKVRQDEKLIAFCGHFSAGKSSMINSLLGHDMLPSSPIPTSANIVKVKKGEEYAKVYFHEGKPYLYPAPYDYEQVKSFCKNGDSISSIEISTKRFPLENNCAVMDTPGIDSADDAHRIATEDALHLADIVFYVMDYNHVQSEVNFLFTKELLSANKKLYLIINQIDKHDETELKFSQFKESVEEGFLNWEVKPEAIYYTSVRYPDLPHNDFAQISELISVFSKQDRSVFIESAYHSAIQIIHEHLKWQESRVKEENTIFYSLIEGYNEKAKQEMLAKLEALEIEKREILLYPESLIEKFKSKLEMILKNAYLMPAETRELAKEYLESTKRDFKVGLLFSKGKTEQERAGRFNRLKQELDEKLETQLERHIKELSILMLNESGLSDEDLEAEVQGISLELSDHMISDIVKPQVSITGEYVLSFTNELADVLRRITKKNALEFLEQFKSALVKQQNRLLTEKSGEMASVNAFTEAFQKVEASEKFLQQKKSELNRILEAKDKALPKEILNRLLRKWDGEENDYHVIVGDELEKETSMSVEKPVTEKILIQKENRSAREHGKARMKDLAENLADASSILKNIKGFRYLSEDMEASAERLENQTFTIALFGAFSAGKSSFANAILGERVLPVSPNPTTAAINKICPPDDANPHATARVKLKTEKMLLEDMAMALSAFNVTAVSLEEAYQHASRLLGKSVGNGMQNAQLSFIRAFHEGLPQFKNQLGTEIVVNIHEFREFAASEQKSCLVDTIELYYDCEITRKGIILVDTPGADSINARHTGTAFEYIKNSDAVLFVTYYNHPFSKADREFLIQLGRVKDSFSMDKMFFIVNAVDLASSQKELTEVMEYMKEQLANFQIRSPKIYPISSKAALDEKLGQPVLQGHFLSNSGLRDFESVFDDFLENDLTEMVISASLSLLARAEKMLREVISASKLDQESKQNQKIQLASELNDLKAFINKETGKMDLSRIKKEIEELAYYSKQRVFLRFNDFFKESFNPAALKDDGRDMKQALNMALKSLLLSLGFDFSQEMRATSLRTENYINKLLNEKYSNWISRIKENRQAVEAAAFSPSSFDVLEFKPAFEGLNEGSFKRELSYFKNPKSFFEKNEKTKMNSALRDSLDQPASEYILKHGSRLFDYYGQKYVQTQDELKQKLIREVEDIYNGYKNALDDTGNASAYEDCLQELLKLTVPN
ncbi:small GTP-binding protein [Peribacillus deserti]|uniref:Small GTP-binding protein n=1 Tax=Peribacillus deserti TaxID=673318 RepID=A0ABS2QHS6_9BACI|nr:dynamin family protein [Peribacillus deserti]MBM7692580.1 small GTP-binding protein [Peribacillus deserti]